jgi:hypothetical protein
MGRLPSENNYPSTPEALAAFFSEQNVGFKDFMGQLKTVQANKGFIDALYERVYARWGTWINNYKAWTPEARMAVLENRDERRRRRKTVMRTRKTKSLILPANFCLSDTGDGGEEISIELERST